MLGKMSMQVGRDCVTTRCMVNPVSASWVRGIHATPQLSDRLSRECSASSWPARAYPPPASPACRRTSFQGVLPRHQENAEDEEQAVINAMAPILLAFAPRSQGLLALPYRTSRIERGAPK